MTDLPEADIRIYGGIGTAAITQHVSSDTQSRKLFLPENAYLSPRRPNGTRRDIDIVSMNPDRALYDDIFHAALKASGERLNVSLRQAAQPIEDEGTPTASKLYVDAATKEKHLRIYQFMPTVADRAIEPWTIETAQQKRFVTVNPRFHLLSYHIHHIRGLRTKDIKAGKIDELTVSVHNIEGLYTKEADDDFAELDTLAETIRNIQTMPMLRAIALYGRSIIRHKTATDFVHAPFLATHYQKREDSDHDAALTRLSEAD